MKLDTRNARTHLVHVDGEEKATPRPITSDTGAYRPGDSVTFKESHDYWLFGRVSDLPSSDAGGVIMVTLDPRAATYT